MTKRPTVVEVDCSTNVQTEREMTAEEYTEWVIWQEKSAKEYEEHQAELAAKQQAKLSALEKLTALGLTEEEAATLVI